MTITFSKRNILYAFYDLRVAETNFDFVSYLVMVERERRQLKYEKIHLVIVKSEDDKKLHPKHWSSNNYSEAQRNWRIYNLVVPIAWRLPSLTGATICSSEPNLNLFLKVAKGNVFPENYNPNNPPKKYWDTSTSVMAGNLGENLHFLKASKSAIEKIKAWLCSRKSDATPVVVTLRESSWQPSCNSHHGIWLPAAKQLAGPNHYPVIVRDMEKVSDRPDKMFLNVILCNVGTYDLDLRLALYEVSRFSIFAANGPAGMASHAPGVKFITFMTGYWSENLEHPEAETGAIVPLVCNGVGINRTPPHFGLRQSWIWKTPQTASELVDLVEENINSWKARDGSTRAPEPILKLGLRYYLNARSDSFPLFCKNFLEPLSDQNSREGCREILALYRLTNKNPITADEISSAYETYRKAKNLGRNPGSREVVGVFLRSFLRELLGASRKGGHFDQAMTIIQSELDTGNLASEDYLELADWQESLGSLTSAVETLVMHNLAYPENLVSRLRLAVLFEHLCRWDAAISIYEGLFKAGAQNPELHNRLGHCFERGGYPQKAMEQFYLANKARIEQEKFEE